MAKFYGPKTRIQFDFKPEKMQQLDRIMFRLNSTSWAEVVRRALDLMELALENQLIDSSDGRKIKII
jgi:hypothetical protein